MQPSRQSALAVLLLAIAAITAAVLSEIIATVAFAVTLAYVLLPVRGFAVRRGASPRVAAGLATTLASVAAVVFFAPIGYVLYQRRSAFVEFVQSLPEEIPITLGVQTYVVEVAPLLDTAQSVVTDAALQFASAAPVIVLKAVVLVLLLFGLLYRPGAVRLAAMRVLPRTYHDVHLSLNRRTAETLQAIYVLQAATAVGTFLLGTATFAALGYESPVVLGVIAGILQFIPVLGPSVLIVVLAGVDVLAGNTASAVTVVVVGLFVVGFLPDAVIRTQLAEYTTELPVSLYFIGFDGGVLTLGAIGFVLGPLVVALLVEVVLLLSDGRSGEQRRLDDDQRSEVRPPPATDSADSAERSERSDATDGGNSVGATDGGDSTDAAGSTGTTPTETDDDETG
ncbi:MAG: AI-2E family transporter [Halobaculum sp.]